MKSSFAFSTGLLAPVLALVVFMSAAWAQDGGQPMQLPVHPDKIVFQTGEGERDFSIEVADEDAERSRGLMFRRDLPEDRGMLFVFDSTRRAAFWMQNTPLPLDLVFIGESGVVLDIQPGEPFSTAIISPPSPVRFVLELNAGTADSAEIAPGDRARHPLIDAIAGGD